MVTATGSSSRSMAAGNPLLVEAPVGIDSRNVRVQPDRVRVLEERVAALQYVVDRLEREIAILRGQSCSAAPATPRRGVRKKRGDPPPRMPFGALRGRPTLKAILESIPPCFLTTPDEVVSRNRIPDSQMPARWAFVYVAVTLGWTFCDIGRFVQKCHTVPGHQYRRAIQYRQSDDAFKAETDGWLAALALKHGKVAA